MEFIYINKPNFLSKAENWPKIDKKLKTIRQDAIQFSKKSVFCQETYVPT